MAINKITKVGDVIKINRTVDFTEEYDQHKIDSQREYLLTEKEKIEVKLAELDLFQVELKKE